MVQGTASSVGKSTMVAALCRILRQDGRNVAPFKAQNMSLNSFVTVDGGEMGRAQVVQAEAALIEPTVDMNPVLLKPDADSRSQVVVRGRPVGTLEARDYYTRRDRLWSVVVQSLATLRENYDVVVIEGAGSPAEVNLKDRDIVNMSVARYCKAPVILVGDIDRGGVFASFVGTIELLDPYERALVKAFLVNKFRGDVSLLTPGLDWLEERTDIPVAGVIPYYKDIRIPEEDSVSLEHRRSMSAISDYLLDIAVIGLPHIANFDDFDPLEQEAGVRLRYVEAGDVLGQSDLIILPGTKSTSADMTFLHSQGFAQDIRACSSRGVPVIGICGGYQMLGKRILDPEGVESSTPEIEGLGLLPTTTVFLPEKSTHQVKGRVAGGDGLLRGSADLPIVGYEIHMGHTDGGGTSAPFLLEERSRKPYNGMDGSLGVDGNVIGTYVHGLFHNDGLRRAILGELARRKGVTLPGKSTVVSREQEYDKLAALVRNHLDMELIYRLSGLG